MSVGKAAAALLVVLCAFSLFVFVGVDAARDPTPRNLPVAVAAPPPVADAIAGTIRATAGDRFDVRTYATEDEARSALLGREIYAAFVPAAGRILDATAAGPGAANAATGMFRVVAAARGITVSVEDLVPTPPSDPTGAGLVILALAQVIFGLVSVVAVVAAAPRAAPLARLGLVAVFAVCAGLAVGAITSGLGSLPDAFGQAAVCSGLVVFTVASVVLGGYSVAGFGGISGVAAVVFLLGNPTAAPMAAPELLAPVYAFLNQALPPGRGVALIRDAAFFDWNGATQPLAVLLAWAIVGTAVVAWAQWRSRARARTPGRDLAAA